MTFRDFLAHNRSEQKTEREAEIGRGSYRAKPGHTADSVPVSFTRASLEVSNKKMHKHSSDCSRWLIRWKKQTVKPRDFSCSSLPPGLGAHGADGDAGGAARATSVLSARPPHAPSSCTPEFVP